MPGPGEKTSEGSSCLWNALIAVGGAALLVASFGVAVYGGFNMDIPLHSDKGARHPDEGSGELVGGTAGMLAGGFFMRKGLRGCCSKKASAKQLDPEAGRGQPKVEAPAAPGLLPPTGSSLNADPVAVAVAKETTPLIGPGGH
jgi:hypothetical protein